jgi:hypothetical protein
MSINGTYIGNITQPVSVALAGGTTVKIGSTATDNATTLAGFAFYNPTGGSVNCVLYWFDGTTEHPIWGKPVATNDTATESNLPIRLRTGNEIRAKGAATVCVTLLYSLNAPNT